MKLCYFSAQYLPTVGGVERYTFNLAKRAVAAGHQAIVVTSALPGLPQRETDENGIRVYRLPTWPVMQGRFPVCRPFSPLMGEIWAEQPDFCVIQTKMYAQSVWAAIAAGRRGIPTIVIDHSTGYMPMGDGLPGLCGRLYEQLACALIKTHHPAFYGVSAAVCRWLKQGFAIDAAGCLPNAVDPEELAALPAGKDWRQTLGLAPGTRLVAYVGRLIPEKGAAALAEAVRRIPGAALAAAGDGPLREQLRDMGAPVYPLGNLSHEDTIALLKQADVYCLPTRYAEGFPTTLLEAAACRCPIVCTPTAGTEELLPSGDCGVILPDPDPDTIAAGLRTVLADDARAAAMAQAAYRNLCGRFTWDAVSDQVLALARQALR